MEVLFLKKVAILFVCCLILSACSQKVQPSSRYVLFDPIAYEFDFPIIKKCLKDAGVSYKVEKKGIYVPESESDLAAIKCN